MLIVIQNKFNFGSINYPVQNIEIVLKESKWSLDFIEMKF